MAHVHRRPSSERLEGVDRISGLPDALLSHILSFLPIEDAFRTCILSNRWKLVFASNPAPDLLFDDDSLPPNKRCRTRDDVFGKNFTDFVDKVFILQNDSRAGIHRFRLIFRNRYDIGHVGDWISAALHHNVEQLELQLLLSKLTLCCGLFDSKTLVVLKMTYLDGLKVPSLVRLPSLKVLHLSSSSFCGDGSFSRLISACHVLEEFALSDCSLKWGYIPLAISISTLRRLSLKMMNDEAELVLDTPCLDHLHILLVSQRFTCWNLKSLAIDHIEITPHDRSRQLQ